jgi:hypothetical protein
LEYVLREGLLGEIDIPASFSIRESILHLV